MLVRVTCAGVQIGSASLDPSPGLAHARLFPTAGYVLAASAAQVLGYQLTLTRYWPVFAGDFADAVAARWQGGPLALEDVIGRQLDVDLVIFEETCGGPGIVHVVVDFRSESGRVAARVPALGTRGRGRARPAA